MAKIFCKSIIICVVFSPIIYLLVCHNSGKFKQEAELLPINAPDIYDLNLFEQGLIKDGILVVRVPGGWLMKFDKHKERNRQTTVFVPFSDEFMGETRWKNQ